MDPQRRRRYRALQVLRIAGLLVALGLMVAVVIDAASGLDLAHLSVGWLVVSAVGFSLSWLGFAMAWVALNAHGSVLEQASGWTRSQLLRYLPGAIWAPMARSSGVPGRPSQRYATVIAEALIFLATAACVGGLVGGTAIDSRMLLAVPAPLVALAVVHWGGRRFAVTTRRAAVATLWLLPCWLLYGLATAAGQAAVGAGPSVAVVVAAALAAWAAGFVVFIAPGGAGVREIVYASLLAGTTTSSRIAAGALASRFAFTCAEILLALVLAALARRERSRQTGDNLAARSLRDGDQPRDAGGDPHGLETLS